MTGAPRRAGLAPEPLARVIELAVVPHSERDRLMLTLHEAGWPDTAIAVQVHLTARGVGKALARLAVIDVRRGDEQVARFLELAAIEVTEAALRLRKRTLRRQIDAYADEQQDFAIDRMAGLR